MDLSLKKTKIFYRYHLSKVLKELSGANFSIKIYIIITCIINLLQIPRTKTVTGTRAFRCAAPQLWNSLPTDITSLHSLDSFR